MKNPGKVILLKVNVAIVDNGISSNTFTHHFRIWLDQVKLMMSFNQKLLRNVPNMERLSSVLCMR